MAIKLDNSVSYELNENKKNLILHFRDKYFAPFGIMQVVKDFFAIPNEEIDKIRSQANEEFRTLKNDSKLEDYPIKMKVSYKKTKLIFEKE